MTVQCVVHGDGAILTVAVTGRLCLADAPHLREQLLKCLAEQPDAILADLSGLEVEQPLALAVFTAVLRQAARWPGTRILLCAPPPATLAHLLSGAYHRLPLFDSVAAAREHLNDDRLTMPGIQEELLPLAGSTRHARDVVTDACLRWDLPGLVAPASLIVTELVGNVIDHADTMMTLRLSLRPRYLNMAVADGSALLPVLSAPAAPDSNGRGRGLLLVGAVAAAWGCMPSREGKVVWAALRR
ncbi:STAS domain-containing protein [Actinoplanes sp. GCM10030250]|uniref:STAS domain-containing protein n=1 Tax=Actinoplanes sp. GCM10030250 TaxID=3273376 RepID=UPI0036193F45